jgi:hypothetical protein
VLCLAFCRKPAVTKALWKCIRISHWRMNAEVCLKQNLVTVDDVTITSLTKMTFQRCNRCSARCLIDLQWVGKDLEESGLNLIEIISPKSLSRYSQWSSRDSIRSPLNTNLERYRHVTALSSSAVPDVYITFCLFMDYRSWNKLATPPGNL